MVLFGEEESPYVNMDILQDLIKACPSEEYLLTDSEGITMQQQQSQYREPPPYPGHSKQLAQPGMRQSFSGSETSTDVSVSSMENLSSSQRQEPQGEETQSQQPYHSMDLNDGGYSILARLGMPTSALQLNNCTTTSPHYNMAGHCVPYPTDHTGYLNSSCCGPSPYLWANHQTVSHNSSSEVTKNMEFKHNPFATHHNPQMYGSPYLTENPNRDFVQNTHLQSPYFTNLPPPPEYPGEKPELKRSYETVGKIDMTPCRSQPDLSRYWEAHDKQLKQLVYSNEEHVYSNEQMSPVRDDQSTPVANRLEDIDIAARATKMVDMLSDENKKLRDELSAYSKKVSKLQKFELEIQKVHDAYESLVKSSKKRERLESLMKKKLEEEVKKLSSENKQLKECISNDAGLKADLTPDVSEFSSKSETQKSEIYKHLLAHNKEMQAIKEQQDLELITQRATIQEQQNRIDILDSALTNAQANVVRLEKECCKKQVQMERLDQLQKAFSSLQVACEKREQMEKQLRSRLEKEVETMKSQHQSTDSSQEELSCTGNSNISDVINIHSLQRLLNEKEAKILQLQTDAVKWEQKYLENAMKCLSQQDLQNQSKSCVHDSCSLSAEKVLDEVKTEKLKYMAESFEANKKVTELETKVRSLETQIAEKDAMIRVFQRSSMTRSSSVHTLYRSPLHSPHPSYISSSATLPHQSSSSCAIKHIKTGSTSCLETGSNLSMDGDLMEKFRMLQTESKDHSSSSDEEGGSKIWQV